MCIQENYAKLCFIAKLPHCQYWNNKRIIIVFFMPSLQRRTDSCWRRTDSHFLVNLFSPLALPFLTVYHLQFASIQQRRIYLGKFTLSSFSCIVYSSPQLGKEEYMFSCIIYSSPPLSKVGKVCIVPLIAHYSITMSALKWST